MDSEKADKNKDLSNQEIEADLNQGKSEEEELSHEHKVIHLSGMYEDWFLDYASYVILERAVPHLKDGLKPVQRRIMHSMKRLDDGRYNKVANLIGHTMQFHPHGDASIGAALVQLGQKDLLIDTQGNWGNIITGDSAAAARYIEARLSKFALEVVFNPKTTQWKASYDGRNKEPITLPVKFPLLLAQGGEGIAVGLASKILPHNFNELIDASINILKNKEFEIFPDFYSGGLADFSKYNDGLRGGNIKVRAKIEKLDKKTLIVKEIPFGTTSTGLIESILKANDKGKIKIKKIDDNTAENVEILIHLHTGVSSDKTIDALFAFTDCEVSISPNCCVIDNDKPRFIGVSEILKVNTQNTVDLLKLELEIRKAELNEAWHFSSLEKIFIENRIYIRIEKCESFEEIIETIDKGLKPFKKLLKKKVTRDDIIRLTEIKIKRISKFNSYKADELIKAIEDEIEEIDNNLNNIISFTIDYFRMIKRKFGKGKERKTVIRNLDTIVASKVVVANQKLYMNRKEGFIGTSLKKEEFVSDCSDIDDVIIFRRDGIFKVIKVDEKSFVGKDIIHAAVVKPNDTRTIYNVVYRDGRYGSYYMKRFFVKSFTRDKEYVITKGTDNSRIIYFTVNPNGEAEIIKVVLKPKAKLRRLNFEQDFGQLAIKGRGSVGNILTKHSVHRISLKEKGLSTLGGRKIWFDEDVHRLNSDGRGKFLGEFLAEDKILYISKEGYYRVTSFELSNHYSDNFLLIEKYNPDKVFTVVHYDGEQKYYYLKRFSIEAEDKKMFFINNENLGSQLVLLTDNKEPKLLVKFSGKHKDKEDEVLNANDFIAVKSYKARGKRITTFVTGKFEWILAQEEEDSTNDTPEEQAKVNIVEKDESKQEDTAKAKKVKDKPSKETEVAEKDDVLFEIEDTRKKAKPKIAPGTKIEDSGQISLDL